MAHKTDANGLVEMAWDPITRIVGSLGSGIVAELRQPEEEESRA